MNRLPTEGSMRVLAALVLASLGLWPSLATAQAVKIGAVVPLTGRYGAAGVARRARRRGLPGRFRLRSPCRGRLGRGKEQDAVPRRGVRALQSAPARFPVPVLTVLEVAGYQRGAAAHAELA